MHVGPHRIEVGMQGFRTWVSDSIELAAGQTRGLTVVLEQRFESGIRTGRRLQTKFTGPAIRKGDGFAIRGNWNCPQQLFNQGRNACPPGVGNPFRFPCDV
jgi:hypothetical protein